jgi:hypothetical protein
MMPSGGDRGGPTGGQAESMLTEDANAKLDKIAPESWNNIALPLTEAVKIIIEELKDVKKQVGLCSFNIGAVGKHVNTAANVAVTECKKLAVVMADQKVELMKKMEHEIRSNNTLLDSELRKPLLL